MDNITDFLYLIGSVFAPMIAIQIADFFLLKRTDSLGESVDITNENGNHHIRQCISHRNINPHKIRYSTNPITQITAFVMSTDSPRLSVRFSRKKCFKE